MARLRSLVAEAVHERLHVLALRVLLCARGVLQGEPLGPCAFERIIAAGVEGELLVLQMQDRVDRGVEQIAIVADQDHRAGEAPQILFEPERAFEIEVVRGLVEQQQIGLGEQHGGECHAHAPAAGKFRAGPRLRRGVEAEAGEDFGGPRGRPVRSDVGQARFNFGDADGIGCGLRLRDQARAFRVGFEHGVEQACRAARHFLRDAADAPGARDHDLAVVGFGGAEQDAEQGRLARPVAADEPHFVAGRDRRRGCFEQRPAFNPVGEVLDANHGGRCLSRFPAQRKARQRSP